VAKALEHLLPLRLCNSSLGWSAVGHSLFCPQSCVSSCMFHRNPRRSYLKLHGPRCAAPRRPPPPARLRPRPWRTGWRWCAAPPAHLSPRLMLPHRPPSPAAPPCPVQREVECVVRCLLPTSEDADPDTQVRWRKTSPTVSTHRTHCAVTVPQQAEPWPERLHA